MQKDKFLAGEGDAWLERNRTALDVYSWRNQDLLFNELLLIGLPIGARVLEIGCGDGSRLSEMAKLRDWEFYGIDPSAKGVALACARGINALRGTADTLPWPDKHFDLVIFGFCLYLCDREDLFVIASEADRVLKSPGWLAILDFYSATNCQNDYGHLEGVKSYKMDYRKLFDWHPWYECYSHKVVDHQRQQYTDVKDNWVAVSVLRKCELK